MPKTLYVSIYGDGASLDANTRGPSSLRLDDEQDEDGNCGETATLQLDNVPDDIAARAIAYVNGNNGPNPYRDGYEAMECINAAECSHVLSCTVNRPNRWSNAECKRLGGCYLCGGMHEEE